VDFDIVVDGVADFQFSLGALGVEKLFGPPLDPSFGSATLDTSLPVDDFIGDVNMDGEVNFSDVPAFIAVLQAGTFLAEADINLDGEVNFGDIPGRSRRFISLVKQSPLGRELASALCLEFASSADRPCRNMNAHRLRIRTGTFNGSQNFVFPLFVYLENQLRRLAKIVTAI